MICWQEQMSKFNLFKRKDRNQFWGHNFWKETAQDLRIENDKHNRQY